MNECIIHYNGLSRQNDLVFVTKRTLKTILLAKEEHEKQIDRHIFQFKFVPKENILYRYHRNPRYSKFTERICQKRADSIDKSIPELQFCQ